MSLHMSTPAVVPVAAVSRQLTLDLVADFTCPWSFLGLRRIARALRNVQGLPLPALLRWHGFRLQRPVAAGSAAWRAHLAGRLPAGISVEYAEKGLAEAGEELGIRFDFAAIRSVPDTTDAHRLTLLAALEGRHAQVADAIFRGWFERGLDIGEVSVLEAIGRDSGLGPVALAAFTEAGAERDTVIAEEQRLQALGVTNVPNLLLNGHVLVPGPADVDTYVQALDAALFPGSGPAPAHPRLLN